MKNTNLRNICHYFAVFRNSGCSQFSQAVKFASIMNLFLWKNKIVFCVYAIPLAN